MNNQHMKDQPLARKSNKREDYFRCPICKRLYNDNECELDPIKGYICPNNCVIPYEQPVWESPLNSEEDLSEV